MTRKIKSHTYARFNHDNITIHIISIQWETLGKTDRPPRTRAVKRLSPKTGWGVACFCPAHLYNKECYHKRLVREYIHQHKIEEQIK